MVTAAHCDVETGQRGSFCTSSACIAGTYTRHPYYHPYENDIAVLTLDNDFPGVVPSRIANFRPWTGWHIILSGFGCTAWDTTIGLGTKRQGRNRIDEVNGLLFQYDENPYGNQAVGCQGDSGGPTFWDAIPDCEIGVISHRQDWAHGRDWISTRVDVNYDWIRGVSGDSSVLGCNDFVCGDGICHSNEGNWNCPSDCPAPPSNPSILNPGQTLLPGQQATSADGRFRLIYQTDGNLVLYQNGFTPIWHSRTYGTAAGRTVMQTDGNLVIYTPANQGVWSSGTHGNPGSYLIVQNDGNTVIYNASGRATWSTGTCCR